MGQGVAGWVGMESARTDFVHDVQFHVKLNVSLVNSCQALRLHMKLIWERSSFILDHVWSFSDVVLTNKFEILGA